MMGIKDSNVILLVNGISKVFNFTIHLNERNESLITLSVRSSVQMSTNHNETINLFM